MGGKVLFAVSIPDSQQAEDIENARAAVVEGHALREMVGFLATHLPDSGHISRENGLRLQLVLLLIRNLLCVSDVPRRGKSEGIVWTQVGRCPLASQIQFW